MRMILKVNPFQQWANNQEIERCNGNIFIVDGLSRQSDDFTPLFLISAFSKRIDDAFACNFYNSCRIDQLNVDV